MSEHRSLMEVLDDDPVNAWVIIAECVAGVALIALLVIMVVSDPRVMCDALTDGGLLSQFTF
jgi:hypothetical protein